MSDDLIERLLGRARQLDNAGDGLGYYSRSDAILDREAADALAAKDTALAEIRAYAHEATKTLTDLVGGGSECFAGRIGEIYIADLTYCKRRVCERNSKAHEQLLKSVADKRAAESKLALVRKALEEIRDESEVLTKLNQERLCCKFQDIAARALASQAGGKSHD